MFPTLAITLSVLMVLICLVWIFRHIRINMEVGSGFVLHPDYPVKDGDKPKVTILVAAKDEEENIGPCLDSLLALNYPNYEIIACNDRSTDKTAEIINSYADKNDKLIAVHIDHLPEGWMGKNNALNQGMKLAKGEYLFFTDADCRMTNPAALDVAMQVMQDEPVGLLCLLPHLEYEGFWEGMIQPMCSGLLMVWYDLKFVNSPKRKAAYANGAFMLFDRKAYDAIDGHNCVAGELQEDMYLAKHIKQAGLGLRVVRNEDIYSVRMYTNLPTMLNGWTRIFNGCFDSYTKLIVTLILTFVTSSLPQLITLVGLIMLAFNPSHLWKLCTLFAAIATFVQLSVIYRYYSLLKNPRILALLYPVTSVILLILLFRSLFKRITGSKIIWKGTAYSAHS